MHTLIEAEARQRIAERVRRTRDPRPEPARRRHRLANRLRTLADTLDR